MGIEFLILRPFDVGEISTIGKVNKELKKKEGNEQ